MNSNGCQICGRALKDDQSKLRGVGPECDAKRQQFFENCDTSESEIAALQAVNDEAARWIRNFHQDMRHGRVRQARQCLEIARRKAADVAVTATVKATPAPTAKPAVSAPDSPEPTILIRPTKRGGYYAYTPFKLAGFVDAIKCVIGGTWQPEKEAWFIPESKLTWAVGAIEYWFGLPVQVLPPNGQPQTSQ